MEDMVKSASEQALQYAVESGVEAEVYASGQRELKIEVAQKRVENVKEARESGLSVRIINQGRLGFAYTSDLKPSAIKETIEAAIQASAYMPIDVDLALTPAGLLYPPLNTFDEAISKHSVEEKTALALEAERLARGADERIDLVDRSVYEEKEYDVAICNSRGLNVYARGNHCSLYIYAVAREDGDSQGGLGSISSRSYAELDAPRVAEEAVHRALRGLKARSMESANLPCVLEPYVVVKFLGILSRMVDGEAVLKGKSLLGERIGQNIAAPALSVVDDATLAGGLATFPFDDEGVPAQKQILIAEGRLKGFLYDNQAAHRAGLTSTGHARRMSFRSLPAISPTNLMIAAGSVDDDELIKSIDKGLYVTELMGLHTANPVSGDFSLGAAGIMIKNGQLSHPVRGMIIAGNMIKMLQDIDAVGAQVRAYGSRSAPSLRVAALSIAGD